MSPTQRSLRLMRSLGYECAITERWNPFAKVRQDLFGFIDIVALTPEGIVGVQTTTFGHVKERVAKIMHERKAECWLLAGGKIEVHGWKKTKKDGIRCHVFTWAGSPVKIL